MERFDVAIIGTGPAGLEAAITAKVRNKSVLLLGSKSLSDKVSKAHTIENYLGLPKVSGEAMQKAFFEHIASQGLEITEDKANTVYAMGKYFTIEGHFGMYEATTVILTCGLSVAKPFPGELENLGRGVSYCATCDAALYREKTAIILGYSKEEENEAKFLAEVASKVYYLPMYKEEVSISDCERIEIIYDINPKSIEKDADGVALIHEAGQLLADGVFILRESVAPSQLVPGLEIENNQVVVDRGMRTNIPGLFAAGDITGAPFQYIKAAGEGNVAALSAVKYISELNS